MVSFIKYKKDENSFRFFKGFGFKVCEIEEPEQVDNTIKELMSKKYNTIIVSNEIAGFSEDIMKKYYNNQNINIIIAPSRRIWI